jgi:predicted nucleic acid-binding protein
VLLDMNVFARMASPNHLHHEHTRAAIRRLKHDGALLCYAAENVFRLIRFIRRLVETPQVYLEWMHLVRAHEVRRKSAHDARLVAIMKVHQVENLLTFNTDDFTRFSHLTVLNPAKVS